jgi:general secretion pathway protein G
MLSFLRNTKARARAAGSDDSGFTLIELLVVIVILGVLSAVVVFAVGGINSKGESASCKATANSVRTASEAYYAQATPSAYATALKGTTTPDTFLSPKFLRLDGVSVTGNVITTKGGTVTYDPTTGAVTDTCV